MAAQRGFGHQRARVVNRLFHAVGGVNVVIRNVRPDIENVCFGERRESIRAHRLGERCCSQSPFNA
jgi:hypothetical protein